MEYDVIIVGAGAAGIPLADRLSADPSVSVLLLDEGQDFAELDTMPSDLSTCYGIGTGIVSPFYKDYEVTYHPQQLGPRLTTLGKVVGGGTAINGGTFLRGCPEDFDFWASLGNNEWSYKKVLPYFRKMELDFDFGDDEFHGSHGPLHIRRVKSDAMAPHTRAFWDACLERNFPVCHDANGPEFVGVAEVPINDYRGLRMSTAIAYLNRIRNRQNLTVRSEIHVNRILFEATRAVGVEARAPEGGCDIKGKRVVLSAGALGSPMILLRSGIGPAKSLEALGIPVKENLPGVGENLQNHPVVHLYHINKKNFPIENLPNQVLLRITSLDSPSPKDLSIGLDVRPLATDGMSLFRMPVSLEFEDSVGKLELKSKNPAVSPKVEYRYLECERDIRRLREGMQIADWLSLAQPLREVLGDRVFPEIADFTSETPMNDWIKGNISSYHHNCGTCKMGLSTDPWAVVDQFGSVYGAENLSIVDASIMPHVVRGNLNATCVMIGERMSDWIRERT
ncbi:uncharacterized protein METZ01_LOCUS96527 [marine metagenome]|uniref:Glucose-methanol-choline oxidoreductase N-terminal domain-containing protein n=1 Tax=marine metagenome TaxID=408172 RepID=A0A381VVR2_9ZZZZ